MADEPAQTLALDGGTPLRTEPWPTPPAPAPAEDADPVAALEAAIAARLDLPPTAVVAFGDPSEAYRAALAIVARTDARDEIILPALLADRAAEVARSAGWRIVPGEVEADTGALSSRGIARASSDRVGLAVAVHAFGHPPAMTELHRMAQDRQVPIVEEISGALGASFREAEAGRMGHAAVMACAPGDPISRGAFAIFPDAVVGDRARGTRTLTLADEDAAVALAEVRRLDEELLWRRRLAWELNFGLRGAKAVSAMAHGRWIHHAYQRYVIRLRGILWKPSIEETVAAIRAEGIPCEVACGPSLHLDGAILAALPGDVRVGEDVFPVASRLPHELIAIPIHSELTSKDMDQVAAVLRKVEARSI